jgi:hypothetical protein
MEDVTAVTAICPLTFPSQALVIAITGELDQNAPATADPSSLLIPITS